MITPALQSTPSLQIGGASAYPATSDAVHTTNFATLTRFLYMGDHPVQQGVRQTAIAATCAAVVRGRVVDRTGAPMTGAQITILNHPEYGTTTTQKDGIFSMAVNGGTQLTLNYALDGFIPIQRQVTAPWQDYVWSADAVLIPYDSKVTAITQNATTYQVAQGSTITDGDGTRTATLVFPPQTQMTMALKHQARVALAADTPLQVRATEYTVGPQGPAAMPGTLPPSSGYTYAVELSVDQATAAGATDVQFTKPVIQYVENFLHFAPGTVVPSGYYDRTRGQWVAAQNGQVITVLSMTNGVADVDTDGDGVADNGAAIGMTDGERQQLAQLYQSGQSFWRVPIQHFTPWDFNWPFGPPPGARGPQQLPASADDRLDSDDCSVCPGSRIEVENQVLGEDLSLTGLPFGLHYRSDRVAGRTAARTLTIPLSSATLPPDLKRIDLEVQIAGQRVTQSFPAQPNQTYHYVWDGRDVYGRVLQGGQPVTIRVGYVYSGVYLTPAEKLSSYTKLFGQPSSSVTSATGDKTRQEVTLWQEYQVTGKLGTWDARAQGLGGWSLGVHHAYDFKSRQLFMGDGSTRSAAAQGTTIATIAGGGTQDKLAYTGPATNAKIFGPNGVAVAADGTVYFADGVSVRRVNRDGTIALVAGGGSAADTGDGGPATKANVSGASGIALGSDGSIYVSQRFGHRIRRIGPDGVISTFAGTGKSGFSGDGGPAIAAQLSQPQGIALGPDGSLYIADTSNNRIRRVATDGTMTTVAGDGDDAVSTTTCSFVRNRCGDGGPATQATLSGPVSVAVAPNGTIYTGDYQVGRLRAITSSGIITSTAFVAGVWQGQGIALNPSGDIFISYYYGIIGRIFQIGTDGSLHTYAGKGDYGALGDGGPALQADIEAPQGIAFGPDGSLYIADELNYRIRRVAPSLPGFSTNEVSVPSEDGSELYVFDSNGVHQRTLNALTGTVVYQFSYTGGLLTQITDGDGNVTRIEHDGVGHPTAIIGPHGQRTNLQVDSTGYLAKITNPANETTQFNSTSDGLLTQMTDPVGGTHQFAYDDLGRLVRDTDPAGGAQTLNRTDTLTGHTITYTSALSDVTQYQVETLATGGYRTTTLAPDGTRSTATRGANGRRIASAATGMTDTITESPDPRFGMAAPIAASDVLTSPHGLRMTTRTTQTAALANPTDLLSLTTLTTTVDTNGRRTTSIYTAGNRTFTTTSPQGRAQSTTIDAQGRIASTQVVGLAPSTASYDTRGRLATLTVSSGADARTTNYTYNDAGYLATITDPLGQKVTLTYDAAGRMTQQQFADGRLVTFGYDANGNLTSLTPPGRAAHTFSYTPLNLLASDTPPDVSGSGATHYSYNASRQLTRMSRPDGKTVDLSYAAGGRLSTVTIARGQIGYAYQPTTGNLATVSAPGNIGIAYSYDGALPTGEAWSGPVSGRLGWTYDATFRVTTTTVNDTSQVAFQYDNDNLLTKAGDLSLTHDGQHGLLTGTSLGSVADAWSYTGFGEPASYTATASGAGVYSAQYTRDKLGRLTQTSETIGGTTTTWAYTYDTAGHLITVTKDGATVESYTYDSNGNRLTGPGGASGSYDAQDRLTQYSGITYSYTGNGEVQSKTAGGQTTSYQYDELGNLVAVTLPNGTQITYLIDGQNRRIGKVVNGTRTQGWLYSGELRPIAELNASNTVVSRFVYASRANVPDYMIKDGVTYRIIADQLGSPRLVVNTTNGQVVQRIDYDSFGNVTQDTNPSFQPFGFAGGLYDRDTALIRFGARDYDAQVGRWTAKDPIGFAGGDSNLYSYGSNDPVNNIDPHGQCIVAAIITLIVGGVALALILTPTVQSIQNRTVEQANLINNITKGESYSINEDRFSNANARLVRNAQATAIGLQDLPTEPSNEGSAVSVINTTISKIKEWVSSLQQTSKQVSNTSQSKTSPAKH